MKIKSLGVFIMFLVFTGFSYAQDLGSEMVEVVKPYTPTVSDAFKIKETPKISDSVNLQKRPVQYSIFSVPVASTFTPAKGRATTVERQRPPKLYDNYITLGFGTYTSALAEFYSNIEVTRSDNFGVFLIHNSAQGGIDGVELDDHYYDTELNLNYSSRKRNLVWNTDFGVEHRLFNWYGVASDEVSQEVINNLDPQHNYYSVYAGGEINWEKSFFDRAEAKYRYFGDDFESVEHRLTFKPTLEIPIGGELFHTNIIFDYLKGSFAPYYEEGEDLNYSYMNLGLASGLVILRDDLTLNLGAAIYYSYDSENSDSGIYVYPQVTASYRAAGDYFIAYAGLEGELRQNSYYQFTKENPFLSPAVNIAPTDQQYNAYVGAKGKLSSNMGYNTRLKYMVEDYKPLFRSNPVEVTEQVQPVYAYGNSFGIVYDHVSTISVFGELDFDVNSAFNLRVNGEFFVYDTSDEEEAWNLPAFRANLIGDYQITEKWFAGANIYFVGERKDFGIYQTSDVINSVRTEIVNLDNYFDLNLNVGYRFNDKLSIFARGHNLLGDNYERWVDYPVLGMQVMAGATYKFDFGR
ncbi:TonB-dependent receptor [Salinimicrobium tongyeongense]|uniref:TonB-dependent receptor n=1 Tax=Salinimicrobium tongyeongense TaxID=2809707 RepID=A0ABY6NSZ3_9FLAO|nr:TonB-dependent receptor [Salinimicrobium tongyeongense]UZH56024.1 TonB-dependent receptor [Salinimicrobium tongyeongense]